MADIDSVIDGVVEDIWKNYDKDLSGALDKVETKAFVIDTMKQMGESGDISEADFEKCFKEFDKN